MTRWLCAFTCTVLLIAAVVLAQPPAGLDIPAATFSGPVVAGATVGAILGGPVGAAIGGASGAVIGAAIQPPPPVRTFATTNTGQTVYLAGEVVIDAALGAISARRRR